MRELACFLLQKKYRASMAAGVIGGLSQFLLPLSIISSAIIGLFILRKGEEEGLYVCAGAAAIIYIMSLYIQSRPGLEFPVALILIIPVFFSARVLRATESQGLAIVTIGTCAAMFAISLQVISGDAVEWWEGWLKAAVMGVEGAKIQGFEESGTLLLLNGLMAIFLGMAAIASLLIARWAQSAIYNPGEFGNEFRKLRIPTKVFYGWLILLLVFGVLNQYLMYDLLIIGAMMYFIQGFATMHCNAYKKGSSKILLLPPYLLLLIVPHYVFIGIACVGVSDIFLNYRKLPGSL